MVYIVMKIISGEFISTQTYILEVFDSEEGAVCYLEDELECEEEYGIWIGLNDVSDPDEDIRYEIKEMQLRTS